MAYDNRNEFNKYENVFGYIYLWTNKINGKQYVGQVVAERLDDRELEHIRRNEQIIDKAITKYGEENFERKIIDVAFSNEELNKKEIEWISKYDTFNNGYNRTTGGDFNPMLGKSHSEETKKKLSEISKNKCVGELNGMFGKKHSEETKIKIGKKSHERMLVDNPMNLLENKISLCKKKGFSPLKVTTENLVMYFYSIRNCEEEVKITKNTIRKYLKNGKEYKGYTFSYISWDEYEQYLSNQVESTA